MKNTKENAIITLVSVQREDDDENKIEMTTKGGFYCREGKYYITYKEHEDMGMGNSNVMLKLEPDCVTMRRTGDFQTVMVYKAGETADFIYHMPFGDMQITVKTQTIRSSLGEAGGELMFSYTLFAGDHKAYNEIRLTVRKEDDE